MEDMRGARKDRGGIDRPSKKMPKKFTFFGPPIHTLPEFRHFFGKIQNAFCHKGGKISARIQKPRAPRVKHDSRSEQ